MKILIASNKGGTGKSTIATNLTVALKLEEKSVILLDGDVQKTSSNWGDDRGKLDSVVKIPVLEKTNDLKGVINDLNEKYDYVVIDTAGKNSREMLSAMAVCDVLVCPLQCSVPDLDTLNELEEQYNLISTVNESFKIILVQSMASTNPILVEKERAEFLDYTSEFNFFKLYKGAVFFRKNYKDAINIGNSVFETSNEKAKEEINNLLKFILDETKK